MIIFFGAYDAIIIIFYDINDQDLQIIIFCYIVIRDKIKKICDSTKYGL